MTDFPKSARKPALYCSFVALACYAGFAVAQIPEDTPKKTLADLAVSSSHSGRLELKVRQMPLAKVLDSIADKTHIPLHYSSLPKVLVTATCVGITLKYVLECLLDHKADLVVRYPHSPSKTVNNSAIAEAWILGSSLDGIVAEDFTATKMTANESSFALLQAQQNTESESDRIENLLKMAQSQNPEERATAIGALLTEGFANDPNVTAALEQALSDQDSTVRSQAVSSYAHREGSAAVTEAIQEALNDSSADVRLMAVDSITNDVALLQQATNDSDETIRTLATIKLEELTALTDK